MSTSSSRRMRTLADFPLGLAILLATVGTASVYGLLAYGLIQSPLLRKVCLGNAATVATVWLFFIALVGLVTKFWRVLDQKRITEAFGITLKNLVDDADSVPRAERSRWLEANWLSLTVADTNSWLGQRLAAVIESQIKRSQNNRIESDLNELASADRNAHIESYSTLRLIAWTIPLVGVLGSFHAATKAVGTFDTERLASQSSLAIQQLSAGLLNAFDALEVAVVLSLVLVGAQHFIRRMEQQLLHQIDQIADESASELFTCEVRQSEQDLLVPVRQMTDDLLEAVHRMVDQQAAVWTRSISESQKQWSSWTATSGELLRSTLCESLDKALTNHACQIEKIQQEAGRQVDSRWQQWQITLSDQARVMHAQQKELVRQTESIERLVRSTGDLRKVEEAIRDSFGSLEVIEQLRQATIGVSEVVAVLASSLERAGIFRGAPVKPRPVRRFAAESPASADATEPNIASAVANSVATEVFAAVLSPETAAGMRRSA